MKAYLILGCAMALIATPAFSADSAQDATTDRSDEQQSASANAANQDEKPLSFSEIDTDDDGYISPVEAYVAGFDIGPMDTDNDGRLSEQEYDAAMAKADDGDSVTTDSPPDDVAAESHLNESLGQADTAPETDLSFDEVDSNKDGIIDKQEASVADIGLDIEHHEDGITREEYEALQRDAKQAKILDEDQQAGQDDSKAEDSEKEQQSAQADTKQDDANDDDQQNARSDTRKGDDGSTQSARADDE